MINPKKYVFTSSRLGFRNWQDDDLNKMLLLNQDEQVMKYFPSIQSKEITAAFINRMKTEYEEYQYCYFAVEEITNQEFLGFIGISNQDYGKDLGKFIDIGWRLRKSAWGKGFATEGAKACLQYSKEVLKLDKIYSVAPKINVPSISVMQKIGMVKVKEFTHPKLIDYPDIKQCVLYEIKL